MGEFCFSLPNRWDGDGKKVGEYFPTEGSADIQPSSDFNRFSSAEPQLLPFACLVHSALLVPGLTGTQSHFAMPVKRGGGGFLHCGSGGITQEKDGKGTVSSTVLLDTGVDVDGRES